MAGPEFFQTGMGRQFYEGTMPELVRQLKRLNDNLERLTKSQVTVGNVPDGHLAAPTPELLEMGKEQRAIYDELKRVRRQIADEAEMPCFIICTNAVLRRIAVSEAKTAEELLLVHGVGPRNIQEFGTEFLRVLQGKSPGTIQYRCMNEACLSIEWAPSGVSFLGKSCATCGAAPLEQVT